MRSTAAALFLAASWPNRPYPGLNVILVVMDTVRADHCSLDGYARKTTPRLEELAAKGLTFKTALAQTNWTIPAHTSLFTGRRPISHGAGDSLSGAETTLAQLFQSHGF